MGVKGRGMKSNGLHKAYMNGSPHDSGGAANRAYTGGSVNISNKNGLNKQFGNHLPAEAGTPGPGPKTGGPIKRVGGE